MKALIVVDIQHDFLPGGALAVPNGNEVVPVANLLIDQFELVVATQDWHPAGHKSFASSHPGKSIGEKIDLNGLEQILWPDHCVQDSPGAMFADELNTNAIETTVKKGTHPEIDSYSGFFDNGHLAETGMQAFLKSREVDHCFVIGLATDYCVKFTVLDSIQCGFRTTVITDACRAVNLNESDGAEALDEMAAAGATLTLSSQLQILLN